MKKTDHEMRARSQKKTKIILSLDGIYFEDISHRAIDQRKTYLSVKGVSTL